MLASSFMMLLIVMAITLILALILLTFALRIVPEYQRLVVFRMGRFVKVMGPGLVILLPFIDTAARVDLREKTAQHAEPATTQDDQRVVVDWLWSYQVVDPAKAVLNVENLDAATQEGASSALRSIIGGMSLNDVIFRREEIRATLQTRLRAMTDAWGVQVRQVEIREIKRN
ncbi:MAG: SPFH domain-containing protein [Chloroflexota bacterium]